MTRTLIAALALLLAPAAALPSGARAQPAADLNAEARVHFERGNRELERAMRTRGAHRRRLLEKALQSYLESLRVVRSRNAVFNTALALEELERLDEAFGYYTEYLAMPDLSEEERAEAARRRDALRDRVAVVAVRSAPAGAEVRVDRRDLAPRGRTPLEIALAPGEHVLHVTLPHHRPARAPVDAAVGERREVEVALEPVPVSVRVETPATAGRLVVDGDPVRAGVTLELPPGEHTVRLELEGRPTVERRVEVPLGGDPMTVRMEAPPPPPPPTGTLVVRTHRAARVALDGRSWGTGETVRAPVEAGTHRVRVEAPDHAPYATEVRVREGRTTELRVGLAEAVPDGPRFGRAPLWLGVGTGALAGVTVGLMVHAGQQRDALDDFLDERCPDGCTTAADLDRAKALDRDLHRANVAADVFLWTTVGLGVSTIIVAILNDEHEQPSSTGTISLVPAPGGVVMGARMSFGGAR